MSKTISVVALTLLGAGLVLTLLWAAPARADGTDLLALADQTPPAAAAEGGAAGGSTAPSKADKTGTNPANFQNTFVFWNEYAELEGDHYTNQTVFEYKVPLQENSMQWRIRIPLVTSDLSGDTEFGIGDLSTRVMKRLKMTRDYAWLVGLESWWDTAREASLGSGKSSLGPTVIHARFYPQKRLVFAPAYQQKFSVGGDDSRPDINQGLLDLYLVKTLGHGERWLLLDPQVIIDYENDTDLAAMVKLTYGTMLSPGHSFYIRPGVGLGETSVEWSLETAFQIIW